MDLNDFEIVRDNIQLDHSRQASVQEQARQEQIRQERARLETEHQGKLEVEPAVLALQLLEVKDQMVHQELSTDGRPEFELKELVGYKKASLELDLAYDPTVTPGFEPRVKSIHFNLLVTDHQGYDSSHTIAYARYDSESNPEGEPIACLPQSVEGVRERQAYGEEALELLRGIVREAAEVQGIPVLPPELPADEPTAV